MKEGPHIRYDSRQYAQAGQQDYTDGIQAEALSKALKEGLITIPRMIPNNNFPGGFQHNDQHICPSCQADMEAARDGMRQDQRAPKKRAKKLSPKKLM
jgi:hypothetical protein